MRHTRVKFISFVDILHNKKVQEKHYLKAYLHAVKREYAK